MSAEKHTPGPWQYTGGDIWTDTREQVCCGRGVQTGPDSWSQECCGNPDVRGGQELIAQASPDNAPLIAAAPDMLATLKQVAAWLRGGDYDTRGGLIEMDRLASVCEAAIAKAREA